MNWFYSELEIKSNTRSGIKSWQQPIASSASRKSSRNRKIYTIKLSVTAILQAILYVGFVLKVMENC